MLRELVVEGLGVIERAETHLDNGSIALTGETGAGKTLVVAALGLLLGGRADRSLIRTGMTEGRVEGLFALRPDHPVVRKLIDHGVLEPSEPQQQEVEILISRSISARSSSSKARINGRLVTATLLGELSGVLVEIAGQHEHQRLGSPAYQRELLDSFAGEEAVTLAERLKGAFREWSDLERRLEDLKAGERTRLRELDALQAEIAQIESVAPKSGEQASLQEEAGRLQFAATIASGIDEALEVLRGDGGIEESIGAVEQIVTGLTEHDHEMSVLARRLEAARYELADVADELRARTVVPDPEALDEVRSRLDALAKLQRRYGDTEEDVLAHLTECHRRVNDIEAASSNADALEAASVAVRSDVEALAQELSRARAAAVPQLQDELRRRMSSLALPDAIFTVALEEHEVRASGREDVTFLLAANPGEEARPLAKVASGGELSRLALALHLAVSGRTAAVPTMIFDEIDAGVGGAAARAVGRALADLARYGNCQVIVVTHLPQVAAFADVHLKVVKSVERGSTRALVSAVEGEERVLELSRMLAGLPGSELAQEHAKELLDLAASEIPVA